MNFRTSTSVGCVQYVSSPDCSEKMEASRYHCNWLFHSAPAVGQEEFKNYVAPDVGPEYQNTPMFDRFVSDVWMKLPPIHPKTFAKVFICNLESPPLLHEHLWKGTSDLNQISMLRVLAVYFLGGCSMIRLYYIYFIYILHVFPFIYCILYIKNSRHLTLHRHLPKRSSFQWSFLGWRTDSRCESNLPPRWCLRYSSIYIALCDP